MIPNAWPDFRQSLRIIARVLSLHYGLLYVFLVYVAAFKLINTVQEFRDTVCDPQQRPTTTTPSANSTEKIYETLTVLNLKDDLCETLEESIFWKAITPTDRYYSQETKDEDKINQLYFNIATAYQTFILLLVIIIPQTIGALNLWIATIHDACPILVLPLARRHQTIQLVIGAFELVLIFCTLGSNMWQYGKICVCLMWPLRDLIVRALAYQLVLMFIVTKEEELVQIIKEKVDDARKQKVDAEKGAEVAGKNENKKEIKAIVVLG